MASRLVYSKPTGTSMKAAFTAAHASHAYTVLLAHKDMNMLRACVYMCMVASTPASNTAAAPCRPSWPS